MDRFLACKVKVTEDTESVASRKRWKYDPGLFQSKLSAERCQLTTGCDHGNKLRRQTETKHQSLTTMPREFIVNCGHRRKSSRRLAREMARRDFHIKIKCQSRLRVDGDLHLFLSKCFIPASKTQTHCSH